MRVVAVLMNPDTPFTSLALQELRIAAAAGGQHLEVFETRTADQLCALFAGTCRAPTVVPPHSITSSAAHRPRPPKLSGASSTFVSSAWRLLDSLPHYLTPTAPIVLALRRHESEGKVNITLRS